MAVPGVVCIRPVLVAVACVLLPSCGIIVDGSLDAIACSVDEQGCPDGMRCESSECVRCGEEICGNGVDDDCDGVVDDGCSDSLACFTDGCPAGQECVILESGGDAQCLQPCACSSTECPSSEVCKRVPFSSKGWCLEPDQAGLDVRWLGESLVGEACDADEDCRSGRCSRADDVCVDVCCGWQDCPANMACLFNTYWYECTVVTEQAGSSR